MMINDSHYKPSPNKLHNVATKYQEFSKLGQRCSTLQNAANLILRAGVLLYFLVAVVRAQSGNSHTLR